ncbi:MAG: valine--tRNA ligase [Mycoplasmoidaceae bacterium]
MDKIFNPSKFENEIFKFWIDSKLFDKKNNKKPNYYIILPPPNITGILHLGHAWDGTIQDVMIRYKRLKGFNTLWIAGMDHAGIATQTKFESYLLENKISKDKFTRKEFINELSQWANKNADNIRDQWKKMGFALDYKNEKFTLSKDNSKFVNKVFVDFYNQGLIYRDYKLVNWDVKLQTAVSNIELVNKEVENELYYIFYKVENLNKKLVVATTRPETMFTDTCLVVNPKDKRYIKLIGQFAINPSNNKRIKIISDSYVDLKYGTGVMKCTPAHDFNDYEIGKKYKQKFTTCINYDGTMNENALEFEGKDRFICRKLLVEKLSKNGFIKKIEIQKSNINYSERSNEVIEPLLSLQWFMKMEKIAKKIKANQKSKNKIKFYPKRFDENLSYWLDRIEDWCISRQLLWGHQIPAWFNNKNSKIYVGTNPPKGKEWVQDNDVFDTWFSSGMWPILATNNSLTDHSFTPSNLLVTGYDIIFFWVARMMIFGELIKKTIPFNDVFIHGLVRDSQGRKMSKSLNNGIDPMEVIKKYGADSLRLFLISSSTIGEDLIYSEDKIFSMSKFLNKLWNIANFIEMKIINKEIDTNSKPDYFDKWIMNNFNKFIKEYENDLDKYNFVVATSKLLKFIKNDFSGTYIELNKWKLDTSNNYFNYLVLDIFKNILILIHPICPFISEKIYRSIYSDKSILNEKYPLKYTFSKENVIDNLLLIIEQVRKYKWENKLNKKDEIKINIFLDKEIHNSFTKNIQYFSNFLKIENISIIDIKIKDKNLILKNDFFVFDNFTIEFLHKKINSSNYEKENILKEISKIKFEIERSEKILSNKNYILKAPEKLVNLEKNKLSSNKKILIELETQYKK